MIYLKFIKDLQLLGMITVFNQNKLKNTTKASLNTTKRRFFTFVKQTN